MTYPSDIYEQRPLENLPGLQYDPLNKKTLFAEDIANIGHELTAIEETMGIGIVPEGETVGSILDAQNGRLNDVESQAANTANDLNTLDEALGELTVKTTEWYTGEEVIGMWLDNRTLYRKIINTGSLPNNTTKMVAHGISNLRRVVNLHGYAFRSSDSFTLPLPFASSELGRVEILVAGSNIRIVTAMDRTNYTESYVVVEYTKTS